MSPWHYWLLGGIVLAIAEIFAPGFVLICFGLGACIASLFTYLFDFGPEGQILTFGIATLIVFGGSRTLFHDVLWPPEKPSEGTNVDALVGKLATVEEAIPGEGRGTVRVGGEQWSAVTADHTAVPAGSRVKVQGVEGNKLLVVPVSQEALS